MIPGTNQPVLDFFPDYTIKRGEKTIRQVTVRHLLTMTAPYKYRSEPWTKICSSDDWTVAALNLLGGRAGLNGQFRYSPLGIAPRTNYHVMTAEEMAKIGQMCLERGMYGVLYGYLWWIIDEKKHIYAVIGNSGNVIYVNPENETVVAVAGSFKPADFDRIDLIQKHIVPLLAASV